MTRSGKTPILVAICQSASLSDEKPLRRSAPQTRRPALKRRDGQIIYIGKAKSLRDRVRSYFRISGGDGRRQFKALVRNIADIDYIVTGSEQEALILEATQIRTHKPRYNILLKDDKKYPYIRITAEPFPRIFATRDVVRDGSRYLGPYSNVRAMHTTLDMLRKVFPIRACNAHLPSDKVPQALRRPLRKPRLG
ncbi:MAG: GIY-YIG nuclease family protein [Candidatus Latescibacteria bacterium]|nr:GIY-YIG nuclease family protein [Candidatus Latescibacterota bacterium]